MIKVWILIAYVSAYRSGGPLVERFYSRESCATVLTAMREEWPDDFGFRARMRREGGRCIEIEEPKP